MCTYTHTHIYVYLPSVSRPGDMLSDETATSAARSGPQAKRAPGPCSPPAKPNKVSLGMNWRTPLQVHMCAHPYRRARRGT